MLKAGSEHLINLPFPEQVFGLGDPDFFVLRGSAKDSFCDWMEILAGVVPVDDLDSVRKILLNEFPDPHGPITHKDLLFGSIYLIA